MTVLVMPWLLNWIGGSQEFVLLYSHPPLSEVSALANSTNHRKYSPQNKIPESSKKPDLNLPCASNCLLSIYIVFTTLYLDFTLY